MSWIVGEVDGVALKRRSIISTDEWGAVKDKMIELMAAQLSDRKEMGECIADSFADSGDVTGGVCNSGYVKNNETAEVAGGKVTIEMSSDSQNGYIASCSSREPSQAYYAYKAFNGSNATYLDGWLAAPYAPYPQWLKIQLQAAKRVDYYALSFYYGYPGEANRMPRDWQLQGSNNNSSWVTLDSRSGISWSEGQRKTFTVSNNNSTYLYYRLYITANNGATNYPAVVAELELYADATPAYANPTTITVSPYIPESPLEKVKVTLMVEYPGNIGAIALGDQATDLLQAYLSYNGNSSFEEAIAFSEESHPLTSGSNIYVFNSDDVDVSTESISSLGMRLQSFDRGVGAPEFKLHAYIIAGKELDNE